MTSARKRQGTLAAGLVLAAMVAGCAPGGITPDGKHVFFETTKPLVGADEDSVIDVYERFENKTKLISTGPAGDEPGDANSQFLQTSRDGKRVLFRTAEKLVNADDDGGSQDVYLRTGGKTKLISQGPVGGTPQDMSFFAADPDAKVVVFESGEGLVNSDDDGQADFYAREGNRTRLITEGTTGPTSFFGMAGEVVFFGSSEPLTGADGDASLLDVYSWRNGTIKLISQDPDEPDPPTLDMFWGGTSADGSRAFFTTFADLDPDDGDSAVDIYQRRGNKTTLITVGGGDDDEGFFAASANGKRVLFQATDELLPADDDGSQADIYRVEGGDLRLISQGPDSENAGFHADFQGATPSLGTVVFGSREPFIDGDTDGVRDLFTRTGSKTDLVSQGPAGTNTSTEPELGGISDDGKRIFFETDEVLVGADEDAAYDVYRRADGKTTLISRGQGDAGNADFDSGFLFASATGGRAFFFTGEQLVPGDDPSGACNSTSDPACSGYERFKNKTSLVTRGN